MIDLRTIVYLFLFLLGCGAVFGLLFYLVHYIEREFPSNPLFFKAARIFLVVAAVLVLIGVILDFMGFGIIRWR